MSPRDSIARDRVLLLGLCAIVVALGFWLARGDRNLAFNLEQEDTRIELRSEPRANPPSTELRELSD